MRSAILSLIITTICAGILSGDGPRRTVIVDTPEVLKGMGPFTVFADVDRGAAAVGIDGATIQKIAEKNLRASKLPIISSDEAMKTLGKICLTIQIAISSDVGLIRLAVHEMVGLKREPNCEVIGAVTYSDQFFGPHNHDPKQLAAAFDSLLNRFIKTYKQQN